MKTPSIRFDPTGFGPLRGFVSALIIALLPAALSAADLEVTVKNINPREGEIGLALFSSPDGFPLDDRHAVRVWLPANAESLSYRFAGLAPGTYAVAVGHDLNGNRQTDTNWLGIPREPWGVTNDVRPTLRAPKYDEAALLVTADGPNRISITLSR
jgi:uncharacterized protein (DUF2141 family)